MTNYFNEAAFEAAINLVSSNGEVETALINLNGHPFDLSDTDDLNFLFYSASPVVIERLVQLRNQIIAFLAVRNGEVR